MSEDQEFKKPQLKASETGASKPTEISDSAPASCKYEVPPWSAMPPADKNYHLEVVKSGTEIEPVDLSKQPYYIVGRMPECHIPLQHPSLSRYHAVLQYCDAKLSRDPTLRDGWYIQDLGSSNGTVVNKKRLEAMKYRPLEIGHVIKFGMSTRVLILQGVQDQKEEGDDETQAKRQKITQIPEGLMLKKVKKAEPPASKQKTESEGCMWGIDMDDEAVYESAEVDPNFEESSDSSSEGEGDDEKKRKPLDLSDPKKTLRVFFEREDLGLPDYQVENIGKNKHRAFIEIPVESGANKVIRVEGEGGNKKEAVAACAREACITLDKMNLLRPRNRESKKQVTKKDWAANDYYDEDEDSFYDRTGDLEHKRIQRMNREKAEKLHSKTSASSGTVHTEQSLQVDLERLETEIRQISTQLEEDEKKRAEFAATRGSASKSAGGGELDELEAYMSALKQGVSMDATTRFRLKHRLLEAQKERSRCERLLSIAKGPKLPPLLANAWQNQQPQTSFEHKNEPTAASAPAIGKLPHSLPPIKFVSNLPKLDAFNDEDEEDVKPKTKQLDEFVKEDEHPESTDKEKEDEQHDRTDSEKEPAVEQIGEGHADDEATEVEEPADKKVYSVFLPPELRQSLDEHADEVDQIWDVDRATRFTTSSISESKSEHDKLANQS